MPAIYQSKEALDARPAISAERAGAVSVVRGLIPVTAALAANDVGEAVRLPAGHVPVDVILDSDDLDTNGTPTLTLDVGFMSGIPGVADGSRTVGTDFLAASTAGQAGGAAARSTLQRAFRHSPVGYDRSIGFKAAAGAATGVASLTNLNVNRGGWMPLTAYALNDFIVLPDGRRMKCTTAGTSQAQPANPNGQAGGDWLPTNFTTTAYNATVSDGTAVWTMADPSIGITLISRPARGGF